MKRNIASYIDHTLLRPDALRSDISQLCQEALELGFAAVCVPPYYVGHASTLLKDSPIKTATVIGFPFGYNDISVKVDEIRAALHNGADELDLVINIAALKNKDAHYLSQEIALCLQPVRLHRKTMKVIIETGLLAPQEIELCCELYARHKVDYLKTSTGVLAPGAELGTVRTMRSLLPSSVKIKASGGIRTFEAASAFIEAGADRLGTSSGVTIVHSSQNPQMSS